MENRCWLVVEAEKLTEHEREYFASFLDEEKIVDSFGYTEKLIENCLGAFIKLSERPDILFYQKLLRTRLTRSFSSVPFLFWGGNVCFFESPLWPALNTDVVIDTWNAKDATKWMELVEDFQQGNFDDFWGSCFEAVVHAVNLNERLALDFIKSDGTKGTIFLDGDIIVGCETQKFSGKRAFLDMLSWTEGKLKIRTDSGNISQHCRINKAFWDLLHEYYDILKEIVFVFSLIDSFNTCFRIAEGNCALDDAGDPNYEGHKIIYSLIKEGKSVNEIILQSPLNILETLAYIYRLLSFGDIYPAEADTVSDSQLSEPVVLASVHPVEPVEKVQALIVDDAPFFRKVLSRILTGDGRFEISGTARDGLECLELVDKLQPDVISLDIEMPRLDGLGTLKRLMIRNPKPVVVLSAFTTEVSRQTYEAFKLGAIDVLKKPSRFDVDEVEKQERTIAERIYRVAGVKIDAIRYVRRKSPSSRGKTAPLVNLTGKYLALSYFGEGSFSLFLRMLSALDGSSLNMPVICVVPVEQAILNYFFSYMEKDFSVPLTRLDMGVRVVLNKPSLYLIGSDVSGHFFVDGRYISFAPYFGEDRPLEHLVDSLCKAVSDVSWEPLFLAVSGQKSAAIPFIKASTPGWKVVYLDPSMCLYPDLGFELKENGVGFEIGDIRMLARCIFEPEVFFNQIKNSFNGSVKNVVKGD